MWDIFVLISHYRASHTMISSTHPHITIAALKGGSGKTLLSLGLLATWRNEGHEVAPFKKGPDFIDAGWLSFAAGRPCHNLDPFLMSNEQIHNSFLVNSKDASLSLIEGNRGLYDGLDLEGRYSTAEVAKMLGSPVLIVIDVTMATRTMAAVVKGCQAFDPELNIAGVILNRVAGSRQEALVRNAIERYCNVPVIGSVPKLKENLFPERHMGLVPYQERDHAEKAIAWARKIVIENLQIKSIRRIAHRAETISTSIQSQVNDSLVAHPQDAPRIGFLKDKSFWFYYQENLTQLEQMGAALVAIDAISHENLPSLDALYIGGGFPETKAQALSDNKSFRDTLRAEIQKGLPVYAECGGFMYLGQNLLVDGRTYPMVGALPVDFVLKERPQGHGYTLLEVNHPNPYYPVGEVIKGHEFHYSMPVLVDKKGVNFAFKVKRGHGIDGLRDGMYKNRLLATYTHVHAAGNKLWAKGLFTAALEFMKNCMPQKKT